MSWFRLLLILLLGLAAAVWRAQWPYHRGSVSDHFDGLRFVMPVPLEAKGLWDVLLWRVKAETAEWPQRLPVTPDKPPARVVGTELRVSYVGHATLLLQTAGINILTDPIWSERAFPVAFAGPQRVRAPGIAFADLPPIDLVVVSHSHYDHMDLPTLKRLAATHDPLFVLPLGNDKIFSEGRIRTLDWWESVEIDGDARVHAVPVRHWSRRGLFDRNKALWAGFVLELPGGPIYFAGDTGFGDGRVFRAAAERFGGFRLALLPIGAYEPRWFMRDQHVNPAEAVRAHQLLKARQSLGMHFGTFQLTDEAIDQPLIDLQAARAAAGIAAKDLFALPVGAVGWIR